MPLHVNIISKVTVDDYFFQNPSISEVYTEHSIQVNVAQYAPSGFYICSGGKARFIEILFSEDIVRSCKLLNLLAISYIVSWRKLMWNINSLLICKQINMAKCAFGTQSTQSIYSRQNTSPWVDPSGTSAGPQIPSGYVLLVKAEESE